MSWAGSATLRHADGVYLQATRYNLCQWVPGVILPLTCTSILSNNQWNPFQAYDPPCLSKSLELFRRNVECEGMYLCFCIIIRSLEPSHKTLASSHCPRFGSRSWAIHIRHRTRRNYRWTSSHPDVGTCMLTCLMIIMPVGPSSGSVSCLTCLFPANRSAFNLL